VVCRARHLRSGRISDVEWQLLRSGGERVWLFRPSPSQTQLAAVEAYLAKEPKDGGCTRDAYKVRIRDPWYRTPLPTGIHGFMSGMSGWGPWVVFREKANLSATNTLYTVRFLHERSLDHQAAWAMSLLTTETQEMLATRGRRYAGGLIKYEPSDISGMLIRRPVRVMGAYNAYLKAVSLLLSGRTMESRRSADTWF
jgi:adenine-specific DNA-methyltransferase